MNTTHSNNGPSDLVQALVSRLEKLEAKVSEMGGLIEQLARNVSTAAGSPAGGLGPQLLAVITAAIDTVVKEPHLIHSIRELGADDSVRTALDWSVEGRRQIFSSHHIR
jgi:hypothetical protein